MKLNILCSAFFVYTYIKNLNGRARTHIKLSTILIVLKQKKNEANILFLFNY